MLCRMIVLKGWKSRRISTVMRSKTTWRPALVNMRLNLHDIWIRSMEIIYRTRCFWNLHGIKVYFRSIIPVTHAPSPAVLDVSGCIGKNSHRVEIKTKIKYINERLLSLYELAFGIELSSNLHAAFRDLFALYLWVNSTHHHYGPSLVAIKPCLFGATTWLELPFVFYRVYQICDKLGSYHIYAPAWGSVTLRVDIIPDIVFIISYSISN